MGGGEGVVQNDLRGGGALLSSYNICEYRYSTLYKNTLLLRSEYCMSANLKLNAPLTL